MNSFQLMLRFTGVIAAVAIAATPFAVLAQTPQPQQPQQSEQNTPPRIVFSAEQQAQFEALQAKTIADIEAVLTQEQKAQFAAGRENGQGFKNVQNLTDAQKTQIQQLLVAFNTRIGQILTVEQKQQIQQYQQNQSNR